MKSFLGFVAFLFVSGVAQAAEMREFICSVDTFTAGKLWENGKEVKLKAEVKSWNGKHAHVTGAIPLSGGDEVILDVKWQDSTLADDDMTEVPGARLELAARLQNVAENKKVRVIDIDTMRVGVAGPGAAVTRALFVTSQLKNLSLFSSYLSADPDRIGKPSQTLEDEMSNGAVAGDLMYNVNCRTRL